MFTVSLQMSEAMKYQPFELLKLIYKIWGCGEKIILAYFFLNF